MVSLFVILHVFTNPNVTLKCNFQFTKHSCVFLYLQEHSKNEIKQILPIHNVPIPCAQSFIPLSSSVVPDLLAEGKEFSGL